MALNFWSVETIKKLVELRNEVEWNDKFTAASNKAQQIKNLWEELARKVSPTLTGVEAREKYNYLLKMFRSSDVEAKTSGNGKVKWRHYYYLKEYFASDPSINPVVICDTADKVIINEGDLTITNDSTISEISIVTDESSHAPKRQSIRNRSKRTSDEQFKIMMDELKESNALKRSFNQSILRYQDFKMNNSNNADSSINDRVEKIENSINELKELIMSLIKEKKDNNK